MRKIYKIFLLSAIITLCLSACDHMTPAESPKPVSATDSTSETPVPVADTATDALQAYQNFLSKKKYQNEAEDFEKTHFAICDLDTNGIPELLISGNSNMLFLGYYTYENGAVTKIKVPKDKEGYPAYGSLYPLPSKNTYIFFRGGPGYEDEEDKNCYMPYTLIEYTIKDHQIRMVNQAYWQICDSGSKAGTAEYTFNGKKCSAEEIITRYSFKITKTKEGLTRYKLPENNYIELLPNTKTNRKAITL